MSFFRNRVRGDESGAALILAIAFMVVAGMIATTLLPKIISSSNNRVILDTARNRQYDADAAIERSIARIRVVTPNPGSNPDECDNGDVSTGLNTGLQFRVDCVNTPSVSTNPGGAPVSQNNVSFAACLAPNAATPCTQETSIITARVNFQVVSSRVVTFVQSWSVNR